MLLGLYFSTEEIIEIETNLVSAGLSLSDFTKTLHKEIGFMQVHLRREDYIQIVRSNGERLLASIMQGES